jgi:hypothetical protein
LQGNLILRLSFGFKNRIINGAMVLDQRYAGASVTVNGAGVFFSIDLFQAQGQSADGVFTVQQSTTAPTGFTNSLLATVTTDDSSIGSTQYYFLTQKIEGFNTADLGFGTASASPVTLSFWVRSSVTGTFGGSLSNDGVTRSYPFTYTISSANTWEQKSVTIAGDTTGTWLTNNGVGIRVYLNIGAGSSYTATAGAWASQWAFNATGATNLIATNGATFYITGVQLEKGSTATSFDYRPYGTELALAQRYYGLCGGLRLRHLFLLEIMQGGRDKALLLALNFHSQCELPPLRHKLALGHKQIHQAVLAQPRHHVLQRTM